MKYLKIALGLLIVAGLMAVTAGSAMAEEFRSVTCEAKTGGKWSNNNCTTPSGSGTFETKEAASGKELTVSNVPGAFLELEDKKAGTKIKCQGGGTAKILTLGTGEQTAAAATKCEFLKAGSCEASAPVTARALHLPWDTKAEDVGGALRNSIKSSGAGEPGYAVECTVAGIFKITDECEGPTNTSLVRRTAASGNEGSEEGSFDAKSPAVKCSVGGAGQGINTGVILLRLTGSYVAWWILGLLNKE